MRRNKSSGGCFLSFGLGSLVAALISWGANHDVFWLIVNALCGWLYVIWYLLTNWH